MEKELIVFWRKHLTSLEYATIEMIECGVTGNALTVEGIKKAVAKDLDGVEIKWMKCSRIPLSINAPIDIDKSIYQNRQTVKGDRDDTGR